MNWRMLIAIGCFAICFVACKKDHDAAPVVVPIDDNSLPAAAIMGLEVKEHTADHVTFRLKLAVFRDSKNLENQLSARDFTIDSLPLYNGTAVFTNSNTTLSGGGSASAYSSVMLMDQSGSISITDPDNFRLDAAHIFCNNLGNGSNASLWYFSGYSSEKLTDFTTDTTLLSGQIETLRGNENGTTPLYDAQDDAITYVKANGTASTKAVMAFTDGMDTNSSTTSAKVITNAQAQGIRLYNIGLGEVSRTELLNQAIGTQGAFMYAKDARQLISMFGNLGKLLDNTAAFYQLEWKITGANGQQLFDGSNTYIDHEMKVTLPYGGEVIVPFRISLN